jgi:hypothetical protein
VVVRQESQAPRSIGELQKWIRTYSRSHGLAESRVRDWLSYMMLAGALENPPQRFTFKGGVALELRLPRGTARATQDLDLTFSGADEFEALTAFDAWGMSRRVFRSSDPCLATSVYPSGSLGRAVREARQGSPAAGNGPRLRSG